MTSVRLSATDEITLPTEARAALQAHAGEELLIAVCGETGILIRKPAYFSQVLSGLGRNLYPTDYLTRERD